MKSLQLKDLLYLFNVNESNKVLQTEMLFSYIFFVPLFIQWRINWYYYVQKAPGQYSTNRKRRSKSWLQTTQRIIRLLILTRFLCSEKENTVFTDPKDRQVKHYYPNKKAVTLSIGSGQKEFLRV